MARTIAKAWNGLKTYLGDKEQSYLRIIHFAKLSTVVNTAIGLGKIIMGIYNGSLLFCISGFYNIGLSFAKAVAVKGYCESREEEIWSFSLRPNRSHPLKNNKKEHHYYRTVGIIVLFSSLAYTIGSIGVLIGERSTAQYGSIIVVGIGASTTIEIVLSLQGVLARRREKETILEGIKLTNLVSSLIGLVLVQAAILGHRGGTSNIYFDLVGVFLGAVSICIGLYMIVSTRAKIAKASDKMDGEAANKRELP